MDVHPVAGETQDEVLAVDLFKLDLRSKDHFADIGCGSGKVAIAAAARVAKVCAIDRNPEALAFARAQADKAGAINIDFFGVEAGEYLSGCGRLDVAFVGGSGGITEFLPLLAEKVRRRIVVNAVRLETLCEAVTVMKSAGIFLDITHMQVSRSRPLAGGMRFEPGNPVWIITGEVRSC